MGELALVRKGVANLVVLYNQDNLSGKKKRGKYQKKPV